MKLGLHLLETCRLRKKTAVGTARTEAEWWERRILDGIKEFKGSPSVIVPGEERDRAIDERNGS